MGHVQNKKQVFLTEIIKADHELSNTFYFIKVTYFWLSYESFSLLFDVFFAKKGSFPTKKAVPVSQLARIFCLLHCYLTLL